MSISVFNPSGARGNPGSYNPNPRSRTDLPRNTALQGIGGITEGLKNLFGGVTPEVSTSSSGTTNTGQRLRDLTRTTGGLKDPNLSANLQQFLTTQDPLQQNYNFQTQKDMLTRPRRGFGQARNAAAQNQFAPLGEFQDQLTQAARDASAIGGTSGPAGGTLQRNLLGNAISQFGRQATNAQQKYALDLLGVCCLSSEL